jgi:hypothetical protein
VESLLDVARGYVAAGLSVIRVRANGTKAPLDEGWRAYSERRPTEAELRAWFHPDIVCGIGVPGGPASGNLAVLDFERWDAYVRWLRALPPALQRLTRPCPLVRTAGGGAHLYVRLTDPVKGCALAHHLVDGRAKILIEVRGNGEQVVAPGSPPQCHKSGNTYEWERRGWLAPGASCAPIDLHDWFALLVAAEALNEVERKPREVRPDRRDRARPTGKRPGDDFNERGTWEETGLFAAGWTWHRSEGDDRGFVTRPGKADGVSGSLGMVLGKESGCELFYCFTSSGSPFEHKQSYNRFRVYAMLKHGGDWRTAARELGKRGYGAPAAPTKHHTNHHAPDRTASSDGRGDAPEAFSADGADGDPGGAFSAEPGDDGPDRTASSDGSDDHGDRTASSDGPKKEPRYKLIDSEVFRKTDFTVEWLVEWFLAAGHPTVVAGPSKAMKTSVLVDLAVSLATATPHLGRWAVPRRVRVALVSGESGGYTLRETFFRVLRSKGLTDDACDGWLKWEFTLPTFADLIDTADFADRLAELGCELVIIDPLYLTLGDIDAKNMFEMGPALRAVAELLLTKHKVTPVIAHHANRTLPAGEAMELQHLAYSGLEQFLGQYVFLSRRSAYQNDGVHELWYRYGGRPGHSGLNVLTIDEGVLGPDSPVRRWDVTVAAPGEARAADHTARAAQRADAAIATVNLDERSVLDAIDAEWRELGRAPTRDGILTRARASPAQTPGRRAAAALDRLLGRGAIERVPTQRPSNDRGGVRTYEGYQRVADDG